jgi:archaellum biogenesis protein FlaJ (TadC family)
VPQNGHTIPGFSRRGNASIAKGQLQGAEKMKKLYLAFALFVFICTIGIVAALKLGFSIEKIVFCTALITVGASIVLVLYLRRRIRSKPVGNQKGLEAGERAAILAKAIRRMQAYAIVLILLLISGLYQLRGEPLALRLCASAINLSITSLLIVLILRTRRAIKTISERMN